jgi:inorganic pyrophosphatase
MVDTGEGDDKILAVAADDMSVNYIESIEQLPPHFNFELRQFFEEYKRLENKTVLVEGFQPAALAREIIQAAFSNYQKSFSAIG